MKCEICKLSEASIRIGDGRVCCALCSNYLQSRTNSDEVEAFSILASFVVTRGCDDTIVDLAHRAKAGHNNDLRYIKTLRKELGYDDDA